MKKIVFTILISAFHFVLQSQSCLPEGITFETQAQIDSFQINYPNCTEIEGEVKIGYWEGTDIDNLNALNVLTSIDGDLVVNYTELLKDLSGLENLTSIGGGLIVAGNYALRDFKGLNNVITINDWIRLEYNDSLESLSGLEGLTSINELIIGIHSDSSNISLTSLSGLDNVTHIEKNLVIHGNSSLQNLSALENLTIIGGSLSISSNGKLASLSGLDNLTSIGGSLDIGHWDKDAIHFAKIECNGNRSLTDISALNNLSAIGGDFAIHCNDSLSDLSGLGSLTTIGGGLHIGYAEDIDFEKGTAGNPLLSSLTGLEALTSIEKEISIQGNVNLEDLSGLNNINEALIENLTIKFNPSLSTCDIQSICDYLVSPDDEVEIYNNAPGCNSREEVQATCGPSCLPEGIGFSTQAEIDNFQDNYPGCTEIEGQVIIRFGDDITNLSGLNNITSIGGDLEITGNESLISLTGLDDIFIIGGSLDIFENLNLKDIHGMKNLSTIGGDFHLDCDWAIFCTGNPLLSNIDGLKNLSYIGGSFVIGSSSLSNLSGLDNLSSIGGTLQISGCDSLESLLGLSNIEAGTISELIIRDNGSLSICEVQSICDYLANPLSEVEIHDNAPGCNTQEEVEQACDSASSVHESNIIQDVSVHPNPFNTSLAIEYELNQPAIVQISIYNHLGKQVEMIEEKQSSGKQQLVWNAEGLPSGVYFCVLKTETGMHSTKMIKLK
jgi:hypothetical protein